MRIEALQDPSILAKGASCKYVAVSGMETGDYRLNEAIIQNLTDKDLLVEDDDDNDDEEAKLVNVSMKYS